MAAATGKKAQMNLGVAEVPRGDKEMGEVAAKVRPHQNPKFTPGDSAGNWGDNLSQSVNSLRDKRKERKKV